MDGNFVFYRDVEMSADWPDKIRRAQRLPTYVIAGHQYPRVRYGRERGRTQTETNPCHDCAVVPGELHVPGCDMERCPVCRGQVITCGCEIEPVE